MAVRRRASGVGEGATAEGDVALPPASSILTYPVLLVKVQLEIVTTCGVPPSYAGLVYAKTAPAP